MVFRIAFLGEFSKDDTQIRRRYGDIPNRLDAGVFCRYLQDQPYPSPRTAHFKHNKHPKGGQRDNVHAIAQQYPYDERQDDSFYVFETSVGEGLETAELYINDKSTDVIIDSGASCNLMSEHVFQSLTGGAVALSKCDRNVYAYAHSQLLQLQRSSELTVTVPQSNFLSAWVN